MAAELIRDFIASVDRDPDRVAVHDLTSGRKTSRGEILAAAAQAARRLDATVPEDGVVMLHGPSGAGYWAGLLAILGSGRRMLPIGIETTARDRATLHDAHRVDAVIETDASVGWAESPATVHLQVMDGIGIPRGNDAGVLARGSSGSLLLRSSGTTGRPAVALRTGAALDRVSETLLQVIQLVDDDEVLATLPMQHAYGIEHGVLAPMRAGASVRFRPGFDLAGGVEALANGVTVFPGVPVTLEAAAREGRLDSRLRLAYSAGSSLPEVVREAFAEAWGCPTGNLYGATELGTITYGIGGLDAAVAGVSIRVAAVVDEDGGEVPVVTAEGSGELVVRSDAMFAGYLAARDAEVDPGRRLEGHFRTGDLGRVHAEGRVEITGRAKIQFDVGGLKVNPTEVEEVLAAHPAIREVAVIPLPLTATVTRVRAVVVVDCSGDPERESLIRRELGALAARDLAPHQRPRVIDFVDSLPRTLTGKLLRGRLIELVDRSADI
ncbi:MAG: fatty acid--CoA ligase family protein [Planctomycetota bacterium]|nr:fatty acid--CoA ligase family protein [Planctomycetota bacterium]